MRRPQIAGQTLPALTIVSLGFAAGRFKRFWRSRPTRLVLASIAIVLFVGLNPVLTPLLSRLIAPQVTNRPNEALIIFPLLAYCVTRAALKWRSAWRHRRRVHAGSSALLVALFVLVGFSLAKETVEAVSMKIRGVVYSPAGVSANLSDRLIRHMLDSELESPPYPILEPPARLTRYLDGPTLRFISEEIADGFRKHHR